MRRFGIVGPAMLCAALLSVLFLFAADSDASEPLLTVFLTGNSEGQIRPCTTCENGTAMGGLVRRAGKLRELRGQLGDAQLLVAGGYEFVSFKKAPGSSELAKGLAEAYTYLDYDLGLLSSKDRAWLDGHGAKLDEAWVTAGPAPQVKQIERNGLKLGVVIFPDLADPYGLASKEAMAAVAAAANGLAGAVDMVFGLSSWGWRAEKELLGAHGPVFDVLLGSGAGIGAGVHAEAEGRMLYVRPHFQGRAIVRLDILARPGVEGDTRWQEGVHFKGNAYLLDVKTPMDAGMAKILAWL